MSWFREIWDSLSEDERQPIRDKARWEAMSLAAVLIDWPSLVSEDLRGHIPAPSTEEQPTVWDSEKPRA